MEHPLDNPVWNALITGNKNFAEGNSLVKFFPEAVAPFTGLKEINADNFNALYLLIPAGRTIAIVTTGDIEIPPAWKLKHLANVYQMISGKDQTLNPPPRQIHALHKQHIPQMLALTKLTNPGPFHERTIELGNYYGIFNNDELIAMAGQRMHAGRFLEISAVCTKPGYTGKGYAGSLMVHMMDVIKAQSRVPFLHVLTANAHAIKLYEGLGFVIRREMQVHIISKKTE